MLKHEKIKKEFGKMSEKEFQEIYYDNKYYKKLLEKDWLLGLKIHDRVAICEHFDCRVFRYGTVTKISRKYITVVSNHNCESIYDRRSGKEVDKYVCENRFDRKSDNKGCSWSEGFFLCRPQDWMERIRKEHRERVKFEMDGLYEKYKDNRDMLEWYHLA